MQTAAHLHLIEATAARPIVGPSSPHLELDASPHPQRAAIDALRALIARTVPAAVESIVRDVAHLDTLRVPRARVLRAWAGHVG